MVGLGSETSVAFFDIGDTLASVRVNPAGTRIEDMVVLPGVFDTLGALRTANVRMGVLSNRGSIPAAAVDEALDEAGLAEFFEPALHVYGRKDSVRIFEHAADVAQSTSPAPVRRIVFVGEDATERLFASDADFLVCPHASLAPGLLLGGSPLRYLRVRVPPVAAATDWWVALRGLPVVPLHVGGGAMPELYALAATSTALELDDLGFWVDRLGGDDEPLISDLFLLRDDDRVGGTFGSPSGSAAAVFGADRASRRVLASTPDGLLVAVPAAQSVESLHVGSPHHGHNLKLTALPTLFDPAVVDGRREPGPVAMAEARVANPDLGDREIEIIQQQITAQDIGSDVERYSGARPGEDGVTIVSRHIHHPDNARAIEALIDDLATLGDDSMVVRKRRFSHEGRSYDNVEAVLPGSGLPGVVLVTAHLDSTAARAPTYRPNLDPAPGADDDGSGLAGVLAAARAILALHVDLGIPRREFRFVFFNAEEHGLVGSRAYARDEAVRGTDIVAVLQLDMVGFDAVPARTFELHAGFRSSATVQKRSLELAELVAAQVPRVSPALPRPQLYPGPDGAADPAEARSDHYSFQLTGYPACLASEDFFAGPGPAAPSPDPNPNYHSATDQTIDSGYACDITRAVTAAAWWSGTR